MSSEQKKRLRGAKATGASTPAPVPAKSAKPGAKKTAAGKSKTPAKTTTARKKAVRRPASRLKSDAIEGIFHHLQAANPHPRSDLEYSNPFTLLVAVVLSAQATDAGVNKATRGLFAIANTPEKMLALGEDAVREQIKSIGLFRNKAKNVIALSKALIEEHASAVPDDRDALERLPGVGRKTANVVLNVAFGHPTIAVDTHLHRISNRTGLAPGKTPLDVELILLQVIPEPYLLHAHHWLILHGRYICVARKPRCADCCIAEFCQFEDKTPD